MPVREKWEYITIEEYGDSNKEFTAKANALGNDGWELVSVSKPKGDSYHVYTGFFKRIKD